MKTRDAMAIGKQQSFSFELWQTLWHTQVEAPQRILPPTAPLLVAWADHPLATFAFQFGSFGAGFSHSLFVIFFEFFFATIKS